MDSSSNTKGALARNKSVSWRPPSSSYSERSTSPDTTIEEEEQEGNPRSNARPTVTTIAPSRAASQTSRMSTSSPNSREDHGYPKPGPSSRRPRGPNPPHPRVPSYLELPPQDSRSPLSPQPLKVQKQPSFHFREGSYGLPSSPNVHNSLPPSPRPKPRPGHQSQMQIQNSATPMISRVTLPLTPRSGRDPMYQPQPPPREGETPTKPRISIPASPHPILTTARPRASTTTGTPITTSPATIAPTTAIELPATPPAVGINPPARSHSPLVAVAEAATAAIVSASFGAVASGSGSGSASASSPSSSNSSPPAPSYTFDEKSAVPPKPVPKPQRTPSWPSQKKRSGPRALWNSRNLFDGRTRAGSPGTAGAAATAGGASSGGGGGVLGGGVVASPTASTPATPMDPDVAQRQRLRSDSNASTIMGMEYDSYPTHLNCSSRDDVHVPRRNWLTVSIIVLSVYSTTMSGLWLLTSLIQPRWGHAISSANSSGKSGVIPPSTASLLTTLFAKSIEMSFVTVFVGFLGQVLSRRAFVRARGGITLAEISMRNWAVQPGSLLTQWESVPYVGLSFLGILSLAATMSATLYTTASDAMVTPKLKFGAWKDMPLQGFVRSSYANPKYVRINCPTPLTPELDPNGGAACLDVEYSGKSFHNLLAFMETWQTINTNGTSSADDITERPCGAAMLHDNTTVTSTWIETRHSNVTLAFETHNRLINNITLAIPHPGVYSAATNPVNGILQPHDLSGVGEYSIRASVVAPAVNVLCANIELEELAPLVYTTWPSARVNATNVPGQTIGVLDWERDVPPPSADEFLNRTAVDQVFRWGPEFGRRPPVWQMFPLENNIITNTTVSDTDAIYLLGKSPAPDMQGNFTVCEMRSWLATSCSTRFSISGTEGGELTVICDNPEDPDAYDKVNPAAGSSNAAKPSRDWRNMVDQWRLAINLNGGINNGNTSTARILTALAISEIPDLEQLRQKALKRELKGKEPKVTGGLPQLLPTMAEALAVLVSSTLMVGGMDTPFGSQDWEFESHELGAPGAREEFNASIRSQEFVSGHTELWQGVVFYPILFTLWGVNALCLCYLVTSLLGERGWAWGRKLGGLMRCWGRRDQGDGDGGEGGTSEKNSKKMDPEGMRTRTVGGGLVTDYTESANLFALAINSPPSRQMGGACGAGPGGKDLVIPYRVGWMEKGNHYYFEEANDVPCRGRWRGQAGCMDDRAAVGTGSSYRNLSVSKSWL